MSKRYAPLLVGLAALLPCLFASPAQATEPWWHLMSGARPTYLRHTNAGVFPSQDEVQELTVRPNTFFILGIAGNEEVFATEPFTGAPVGAYPVPTAANVQKTLEGAAFYGPGNVVVSGGNSKGEGSLRIESVGADADKTVLPLELVYVETGLGGSANIKVVTPGSSGRPKPDGTLVATVINVGDASTSAAVTISDKLPPGLEAVSAEVANQHGVQGTVCPDTTSGEVQCTVAGLEPFAVVEVQIGVVVDRKAKVPAKGAGVDEEESNVVSVSGGGAPAASIRRAVKYSEEPVPFGIEEYTLTPEEEGGRADTQAGSHPFQTTFAFGFNELAQRKGAETTNGGEHIEGRPAGMVRDVKDNLPPGLIGNPQALARCTSAQFLAYVNECPANSVVGVVIVTVNEPAILGLITEAVPLFNLEPAVGEPAKFGFLPILGRETPIYIDTAVRSGGDYGIVGESRDIPQTVETLSSVVTFWGVPGEAAHNLTRAGCLEHGNKGQPLGPYQACEPNYLQTNPAPFFELPTSCPVKPGTNEPEPMRSSVELDSWEAPAAAGQPLSAPSGPGEPLPALDGCDHLPFAPSIEVHPDAPDASTATGLTVDVKVSQAPSLNANGLGEADVRNTTVTLPEGVAINPAGGDGLEACTSDLGDPVGTPGNQIGYEGPEVPELEPGVGVFEFSPSKPGSPEALRAHEGERFEPGLNFCSNASKIGTVRIKTPILANDFEGAVYLAPQEQNPFGSLIAMYIVAEEKESGVLLKLPGEVTLNPSNGQITSTFMNTPQAPVEEIELHFFGGERAPLATPAHCGSYTTSTSIMPWSAEPSDEAVVTAHPSSTFAIERGPKTNGYPEGSPCPGASLPLAPTVTGGAANIQAGAYTPFVLTMSRENGEQHLSSVEAKVPQGLSGNLSNVELCPEPQANEGTCGPNSLIGETTVSVGVGERPFTVKGGRIYITGPYNGQGGCTPGPSDPGCAPFGVSVVNPAKAGPYDLANTKSFHPACDCVLVRGKIEINPETAAIKIVSDPPGSPDAIPTMLEGIPLQIQHVNITTTRNDFQFNPTNCSPMQLEGTLFTAEGGSDTIKVPFQATNCASLKFEPKFSVSTSGKTSREDGASLGVKLTYPSAPQGTEANIKQVKVELPKQLPSRLTTLQKACSAAQFKADPAGCPALSVVGHVKAVVPNIPVPLEGPAYFVSNGGEAFPNLILVLQGYNVTIDLVGDTFINKAGVTSSTFKAIPDNPVSSFELTLPKGPFSALAANGNLCKQKLTMPTEFVAQNGAEIKTTTKIAVTGCPKHEKAKTKHRKGKKATRHRRRRKK